MTDQQFDYFEQTKASGRAFAFLGLLLGVTGGVLTGVAVKGLIGDPVVEGMNAALFYVTFGLSSLITMAVMLNYMMMNLNVSGDGLNIKIGMRAVTLANEDIAAVRVAETKSRMSRSMAQGGDSGRKIVQMWTVLGVGSGVEVDVLPGRGDGGGSGVGRAEPATWFIGSRTPEKLIERIQALIGPVVPVEDTEALEPA